MKRFKIIAAVDNNFGIGFNNNLPWPKIKEDMEYFYKTTSVTTNKLKNAVIMGRKTWQSIPKQYRPLKNRLNIVITSNRENIDNVIVENSLNNVLNNLNQYNINECFVIGGSSIYKEAINYPNCEEIYLTRINKSYVSDVYFPNIPKHFKLISSDKNETLINDETIELYFDKYKNEGNYNSDEYQYLNLVENIINNGETKKGRNGLVKTIFGIQHVFGLENFPLLTTKKMFFSGIVKELLFFLKGQTNSKILENEGVKIWTENTTRNFLDQRGLKTYQEGDMGPMYGYNWRHYGYEYKGFNHDYKNKGFDQLKELVTSLNQDPNSRRHLLTTYDPSVVDKSVLAPCHGIVIQFNIRNNKYLDCKMYQRSADIALGYPFNIASYAILVNILCEVTSYLPGKLYMTLGDCHLYEEHIDSIKEQLNRIPLTFPKIELKKFVGITLEDKMNYIESLNHSDISLKNYDSHPHIKFKMIA